jgi:hypothetical protein
LLPENYFANNKVNPARYVDTGIWIDVLEPYDPYYPIIR